MQLISADHLALNVKIRFHNELGQHHQSGRNCFIALSRGGNFAKPLLVNIFSRLAQFEAVNQIEGLRNFLYFGV